MLKHWKDGVAIIFKIKLLFCIFNLPNFDRLMKFCFLKVGIFFLHLPPSPTLLPASPSLTLLSVGFLIEITAYLPAF